MYNKLNETFKNIFVITVPNINEINGYNRYDDLKNRFKGINYQIFNGVDGRTVDKEYYDDIGSNLTYGQLGCTLSHINLYKKIVDENIDITLILEDDCIFTEEIKNLDKYMNQLPDDWEMVYLGYLPSTPIRKSNYGENIFRMDDNNTICVEGTHSLILKKSFAQKLYDYNKNAIATADGAIYGVIKHRNSIGYAFVPSLSYQYSINGQFSLTCSVDNEMNIKTGSFKKYIKK